MGEEEFSEVLALFVGITIGIALSLLLWSVGKVFLTAMGAVLVTALLLVLVLATVKR